MKKWIVLSASLGLTLAFSPLLGGCSGTTSRPLSEIPAADTTPATVPATLAADSATNEVPEAAADLNLANAPVTTDSAEKPVPANVRATGPVAELVKLTESGVSESVLQAFVANSPNRFDLSADEIIYLNDLGIPGSIITAVFQHDQALKNATLSAQTPSPAPPNPEPALLAPAPAVAAPPSPTTVVVANPPPGSAVEPYSAPVTDVVQSSFDAGLSPYGTWVDVEGYGRCWQPTVVVVNPGWQPYFDGGHWVYTDCGWYWVSDYSWGWAPFHYGRWFRHSRLGWCWAPDTVWGPSWVCWRYTENHCGWAPLPPGARFHPGLGLTYHGAEVGLRFDFGLDVNCFAFVEWGHFQERHLRAYDLPREHALRVYHQSTLSTAYIGDAHRVSNHGLAPEQVAAATRTPVHAVAIRERSETGMGPGRTDHLVGNGRTLEVFRPKELPAPSPASPVARGGRAASELPAPRSAPARPEHVGLPAGVAANPEPAPRSTVTVINRRGQPAVPPAEVVQAPASTRTPEATASPKVARPTLSTEANPSAAGRAAESQPAAATRISRPVASSPTLGMPARVERPAATERVETSRPLPVAPRVASPSAAAPAPAPVARPLPAPTLPPAPRFAPAETPRPSVPILPQPAPRAMPDPPSVPRMQAPPQPGPAPAPSAPARSAPSPAPSSSGNFSTDKSKR